MSVVNHFRNKLLSAQRNIQILCQVPPNREGIFCLCVENVMHVLDPFKSHGVGRIATYKVSVVVSGQRDFALKIALKCLSKVSE